MKKRFDVMIGFPEADNHTVWVSTQHRILEYFTVADLKIAVLDVEEDKLYHWQPVEEDNEQP